MNRAKLDSMRFDLSRKGFYLVGLHKYPAKIQRLIMRQLYAKLDKLAKK